MDGYEPAARLRDLPELNGVRLFALTGYGQQSDRQKARDAGFDHHFTKPIDLGAIDPVLAVDVSRAQRAKQAPARRQGETLSATTERV
jgi:CheY-like chemotaxis protein